MSPSEQFQREHGNAPGHEPWKVAECRNFCPSQTQCQCAARGSRASASIISRISLSRSQLEITRVSGPVRPVRCARSGLSSQLQGIGFLPHAFIAIQAMQERDSSKPKEEEPVSSVMD